MNFAPVSIVVATAGFVYVGRPSLEDGWLTLRSAYNIRVWGTSDGLGQLVNGPLADTVLDLCGTVRIPLHAVISVIDARADNWPAIKN